MKSFLFSALAVLLLLSCNNTTGETTINKISDTTNMQQYPPAHDTSYSVEKEFVINDSMPFSAFFLKMGAVKGHYKSERIDWCARSKKLSFFDKSENEVFTVAVDGMLLLATKKEYDVKGGIANYYTLYRKLYNNYNPVEIYYASDSALLNTIVPVAEQRWTVIQDSLNTRK